MNRTIFILVTVLLDAGLGSGCASQRRSSSGDDLSPQVRETFRQNKVAVPAGYQNDDERRTAYPGGTTAAEWKSLSGPDK